jgi:NitT/TauT family transport system ATP-binding protein
MEAPYRDAPKAEALPRVVEFRGVTKTYNEGKPREYTAIKDVTFHVDDLPGKGEFIAVLGPSGCGKSTLLKLIAGLDPQHPPSKGEVIVRGEQVVGPGADRGMVFQEYTAFDNRTVLDNVAFGLECRGVRRREREDQAMVWIRKVGLDPFKDSRKYPHQLSGGMRQRVAIARSLILRPRILLMDEPFGALDPMTRLRMQDLLVNLWNEVEATVFFVTHSIEEGVFLGDRAYLFSGAPGTIAEQLALPRSDRPAIEMQSEPEFIDKVKYVRSKVAAIEEQQGVL